MASTSSSGRAYDSIDDEEISTIIDESIPKNTKKTDVMECRNLQR